jgi:hypothetical protein
MIFFAVTITTSGTPQKLSAATSPALPSMIIGGVTYPSGSAATGFKQLVIQNPPGSTGNLYVGGSALVKGTLANLGQVLIPGASITFGQWGGDGLLDDIWVDTDTSGNKAIVCLQ